MRKALGNANLYLWLVVVLVVGAIGINEYFRYQGKVGVNTVVIRNATAAPASEDVLCFNCYSKAEFEVMLSEVIGKSVALDGSDNIVDMERWLDFNNYNIQIASFYYEPYISRADSVKVMLTNITDSDVQLNDGNFKDHVDMEHSELRMEINDSIDEFEGSVTSGMLLEHFPVGPDRTRWDQYSYMNHTYSRKVISDSVEPHSEDIIIMKYLAFGDYNMEIARLDPSTEAVLNHEVKPIRHIIYSHSVAVRCNPSFVIRIFADPFETEPILDEFVNTKLAEDRAAMIRHAEETLSRCRSEFGGINVSKY